MTHQCDDTAYPAAAMPGACTCPPEDRDERPPDDEESRLARLRIFGEDD